MGSRLEIPEAAYIAGFLDGDGSVMLQLKKRSDTKVGWRCMFTICFYQDSGHDKPRYWIREKLGIGYISKRNDRMSELRINGYKQVKEILLQLQPYVRFKHIQVSTMIEAATVINENIRSCSVEDRKKLLDCILTVQQNNYRSSRRNSPEYLARILSLTL